MNKKTLLLLSAILGVLLIVFFFVTQQTTHPTPKTNQSARQTYQVKQYQPNQYRGVYQSKGYIELPELDNNQLLINDGDPVTKGVTKLTQSGYYATMSGIFSKQQNQPNRIYQDAGEVQFTINENEYRQFKVNEQLNFQGITSQQTATGHITAIAKVPTNSTSAISKYTVTAALEPTSTPPYFFGEHLVITPDVQLSFVPQKYVTSQHTLKIKIHGQWQSKQLNVVEHLSNGYLFSLQDLPVGTEVKAP